VSHTVALEMTAFVTPNDIYNQHIVSYAISIQYAYTKLYNMHIRSYMICNIRYITCK
jgi:hypothetical protein